MTYRLMAEKATDMICSKLGTSKACMTASEILPLITDKPARSSEITDRHLICECENVTSGEIKSAVRNFRITSLEDLRRRTRIGMGTCQGTFCIHKAAKALAEAQGQPENADKLADEYLEERWKGMMPVGWGDTIREMEFMQRVYKTGKPSTFKD